MIKDKRVWPQGAFSFQAQGATGEFVMIISPQMERDIKRSHGKEGAIPLGKIEGGFRVEVSFGSTSKVSIGPRGSAQKEVREGDWRHCTYHSGNMRAQKERAHRILLGEAAPPGGYRFPACQAVLLPHHICAQLLSQEGAPQPGRRS